MTSQTGLGYVKGLSVRSFHSPLPAGNSGFWSAPSSPSPKRPVPLDSEEGKTEKKGATHPTQCEAGSTRAGCPEANILFLVISLVPPGISCPYEPSFLLSLSPLCPAYAAIF